MNTQASVLFQFDKWIRNLVRNPFRVVCVMHHLPRVAMSTWQPWALLHNAVGVEWPTKDGFERRGGGGGVGHRVRGLWLRVLVLESSEKK